MSFCSTWSAAGNYSPANLSNGQLPNGDKNITLNTYDGNWVRNIKLPTTPSDGTTVKIVSQAAYYSTVSHPNLDVKSITIRKGERATLVYTASSKKWIRTDQPISKSTAVNVSANVNQQSPNTVGKTIDNTKNQSSIEYSIGNGNWTGEIFLPNEKRNLKDITITSQAAWPSKINNQYLLTKSTTSIQSGDKYVLTFNSHYQKWAIQSAPERRINARDIKNGIIPAVTSPNTVVQFANANHISNIALPSSGNEGDTITIRSTAAWDATIAKERTDMPAKQPLKNGYEYVFVYRSDRKHWALFQSPIDYFDAKDFQNGYLKYQEKPEAYVYFSKDNWIPQLRLPTNTIAGNRIHIQSDGAANFNIIGKGLATTSVKTGEWVTFIADASGNWKRETITIDLLAYYSHKNVAKIGENAARTRLVEGLKLTNAALINSGAIARYRMVGIEKLNSPASWEQLIDPLKGLPKLPEVEQRRKQLKADALYYEGTEKGCGLAWAKSSNANLAVATGSLNCGTIVMRHELGHNLSIGGYVDSPEKATKIALGYSKEKTVMGGNSLPYFSTPDKLSPITKLPLGFSDKIDGVKAINSHAPRIASFY